MKNQYFLKLVKKIFIYAIWVTIALIIGIGYMRIVLGPKANEQPTNFLEIIFTIIYNYGLINIGLSIGGVIALMFVILDVFYLTKKLRSKNNQIISRFLVMLFISIIVVTIHYVLEKVIDII